MGGGHIRLDKWLWQARLFKSRSLSAAAIAAGKIRLNGNTIFKPAHSVGPGDVLTFANDAEIRVIRIVDCGTRRGPAAEAQALYRAEDGKNVPKPQPLPE